MQTTYDAKNPRHRINAMYAGRYDALEAEAALKAGHDDFLCVGHMNCPHCQAEKVLTYISVDKAVAWRVGADVKNFYFEVFQGAIADMATYACIEIHPSRAGEWWVKASAKLGGMINCQSYSWMAEPYREARTWTTALWDSQTGACKFVRVGDKYGRTILEVRDTSAIVEQRS